MIKTPIIKLRNSYADNSVYIKREDMIPYSFGGNKARKGVLFFEDIDKGDYDTVVTYGSSHSNHCRIIANMAKQRGMDCILIGPTEVSDETFNSKLMDLLGAKLIMVPVEKVHDTIENTLEDLKSKGKKPYFIQGGGHGNIGTRAYVECYEEIVAQEKELGVNFDYIFFASGTGTTHAGLVVGQLLSLSSECNSKELDSLETKAVKKEASQQIIGISIARQNPRGRDVVLDSIREYAPDLDENEIQNKTIFIDDYVKSGYGLDDGKVSQTIARVLENEGIPLDVTYTGKAFSGMVDYLKTNQIKDKNILFIHTGGTPLFFDWLRATE